MPRRKHDHLLDQLHAIRWRYLDRANAGDTRARLVLRVVEALIRKRDPAWVGERGDRLSHRARSRE